MFKKCKFGNDFVDLVIGYCNIYSAFKWILHKYIRNEIMQPSLLSPSRSQLSTRTKTSLIATLGVILLSNTVLAESYQSFSSLGYSQDKRDFTIQNFDVITVNGVDAITPAPDDYYKWESNSLKLSSQYFFDERKALGPLNEFDYINTSSNIYASINSGNNKSVTSRLDGFNWDTDSNNIAIGGQWITHDFIIGAGYNYFKYDGTGTKSNSDKSKHSNSDKVYTASLGYFLLDDLVIRADYSDGGKGDDYFSYSAKYNWQLAGADYVGFTYNVNEDFDIHQLSTRYFVAIADESYFVLGGAYTLDKSDNVFADDYWGINSSYYFNSQTSVSASYDENNDYEISARYFINNNYAVQAGYNSSDNDKDNFDSDGFNLSISAQF